MKRTVTALYETRGDAERAAEALKAQNLTDEVEICDAEHADAKRHHRGVGGWLGDLFGGHRDHQLYAEGLSRGHVLLVAKVDDLNEARAGSVMEAAAMDLGRSETKWRGEGWSSEACETDDRPRAPTDHHPAPLDTGPATPEPGPYAHVPGSSVRAYTL